ncbi:MAG TPA: TadE family protein [Gemmatimonadales bacterium]|nr:TadE family protein [Gemmatimonadales bacterium]
MNHANARLHGLRGERGQALAEFALVLPLLLLLIAGIIEFGRAWNIQQAVTDASREGARLAVISDGASMGTVRAKVEARLTAAHIQAATIDTIDFSPAASWKPSQPDGSSMTVTVRVNYEIPFLGALMGLGPIKIGAQTVMRNE